MYIHIANAISLVFPYKEFLKLETVFFNSTIKSKIDGILRNNSAILYNFLTEIGKYSGETYFIGYGDDKKWISLNLIEGSDEIFIHTSLKDSSAKNKDISQNFVNQGFMIDKGNCNLYKVGKISETEQNLISSVNDIVKLL